MVVFGMSGSPNACLAQNPAQEKGKPSPLKTIVTCQFKATSIEEILGALQSKYYLSFTYVNNEIPLEKKVSVQVVNQPLEKALEQIFRNTQVSYQEIGSQILLKKKGTADTLASASPAQANPRAKSAPDSTFTSTKMRSKGKWSLADLFSFSQKPKQKGGMGAAIPVVKDSAALREDSIAKAKELKKQRNKQARALAWQDWQWRLGTHLALEHTYRFLNGGDPSVASRNVIESGALGYAFGVSLDYKLSKSFYLRTGLDLLKWKEGGNYTLSKEYLPPPPQRPKGYPKDTSISYTNKYWYLGIPLMLGYTYGDRWFVSLNTGLEPTLFLSFSTNYPQNSGPMTYPEGYVPNPDIKPPKKPEDKKDPIVGDSDYYYKSYLDAHNRQFNKLGLAFLMSAEVGYRIDERFSVSISPVFRCFLTSIQQEAKEKPYSYGLGFSFYCRLQNTRK